MLKRKFQIQKYKKGQLNEKEYFAFSGKIARLFRYKHQSILNLWLIFEIFHKNVRESNIQHNQCGTACGIKVIMPKQY